MKMCDICGRVVPDTHAHLPSGDPVDFPPPPAEETEHAGYTYPLPPMDVQAVGGPSEHDSSAFDYSAPLFPTQEPRLEDRDEPSPEDEHSGEGSG